MARKRMKGCKYNRVSQQQKYIFLKLCITQKQSIHEAAYNAGIHYSTAKTILFFHKKNYKNYSSYHVQDPDADHQDRSEAQHASYKSITIDLDQATRQKTHIEIIVNSKFVQKEGVGKKYCPLKQKTNMFSESENDTIKIEAESVQLRPIVEYPKEINQCKLEQIKRTEEPQADANEIKREADLELQMS